MTQAMPHRLQERLKAIAATLGPSARHAGFYHRHRAQKETGREDVESRMRRGLPLHRSALSRNGKDWIADLSGEPKAWAAALRYSG